MAQVTKTEDRLTVYTLEEKETHSWAKVAPGRGGILFSLGLHGEELLYLDEETFYDMSANVRGGNPILFPICGQLKGGEYEWEGQAYRMKNHGVARTSEWQVEDAGSSGEAALTLSLRSSDETKASYPFDFELRFTYILKAGQLEIHQEYRNRSPEPMPMVAGFHPYFIADTKDLVYETDATELLDYNDQEMKATNGHVDLSGKKEAMAFLNAKTSSIRFSPVKGRTVELVYGEAFRYVVVWSVEGKDFVCVEPWTGLNEAMNCKEGLILVQPGDAIKDVLTIRAKRE